jgi:hypothetical protein
MSEHQRYGFVTDGMNNRLFFSVPGETAVAIQRRDEALTRDLKYLSAKRTRFIDIEPDNDNLMILINTKKIGRKKREEVRRLEAAKVLSALGGVSEYSLALGYDDDPNLEITIGRNYVSDSRMHMDARIRWPENRSDQELVNITTYFMQDTGRKLRYEPSMLKQLVGSDISREHGVTLTANPYGGASLETAYDTYDPRSEFVEVIQHNIYNPIQQIVLLAGAVALAHVDDLTVPGRGLK